MPFAVCASSSLGCHLAVRSPGSLIAHQVRHRRSIQQHCPSQSDTCLDTNLTNLDPMSQCIAASFQVTSLMVLYLLLLQLLRVAAAGIWLAGSSPAQPRSSMSGARAAVAPPATHNSSSGLVARTQVTAGNWQAAHCKRAGSCFWGSSCTPQCSCRPAVALRAWLARGRQQGCCSSAWLSCTRYATAAGAAAAVRSRAACGQVAAICV